MPRLFWIIVSIAALSLATAAQSSGAPPATQSVSEPTTVTVQQPPARPAPPPANASAAELEEKADGLRALKAYVDAMDYYKAALVKSPNSAVLHNKLGIALLQMQHLNDAQKEFQRALKLDKNHPEATNNLGVIYYLRKKYSKAVRQYEKAVKLRDTSASFHSNLGTAHFARKEYDQATAEYQRAYQLDPEVFERQSLSGVSLRILSDEDRARYSYMLAKICARVGHFDRSLQYLKKAIEEGYPVAGNVYKDEEFAALRKDPRFAEVMARFQPVAPN